MKITQQQLKQIIREELENALEEDRAARVAAQDRWRETGSTRRAREMKFVPDEDYEEWLAQDIAAPFEKAGELTGQAAATPGKLKRGLKNLKNKFTQGYQKGLAKEGTGMTSKDFKDMIHAELHAIVSESGAKE
tara:strand:+ start:99 stop:500 length:402 start_codon:yes stop_codon:yes gene_type:complete